MCVCVYCYGFMCFVDQAEAIQWGCRGEHLKVSSSLYFSWSQEGKKAKRLSYGVDRPANL